MLIATQYCNALYCGLDQFNLNRHRHKEAWTYLSSIGIAALTSRVQCKMWLLVFKSLNGLAPLYLFKLLSRHAPARTMRSSTLLLLDVPRTKLKSRGVWAFSVVGPKLGNSLPLYVRSESLEHLKSLLKTHLFSVAFNRSWAGLFLDLNWFDLVLMWWCLLQLCCCFFITCL